MPLPRVARTRSGHAWGETWRLFVAFFFGMVVWAFMQAELGAAHAQPRFDEAWVAIDVVIGVVATGLLLWRRPRHRGEGAAALTKREREVALTIGRGLSNAEISRELYLSVPTVRAHVSRILEKLGADNPMQIAIVVHEADAG